MIKQSEKLKAHIFIASQRESEKSYAVGDIVNVVCEDKNFTYGTIVDVISLPDVEPRFAVLEYYHKRNRKVFKADQLKLSMQDVGARPFSKNVTLTYTSYDLTNVFSMIGFDTDTMLFEEPQDGIEECTFTPFVQLGSKLIYYQREFEYTIADCQALIESIYQRVDVGRVVIRRREYNTVIKLNKEGLPAAFHDVVDGKQRLIAITKFLACEYPDSYGNFYSDLSARSKRDILNTIMGVCLLKEDVSDEQTFEIFCRVNRHGKAIDATYIDSMQQLLIVYKKCFM